MKRSEYQPSRAGSGCSLSHPFVASVDECMDTTVAGNMTGKRKKRFEGVSGSIHEMHNRRKNNDGRQNNNSNDPKNY